jgi:tRNA pseudouridine-54 N-methylase|tara:strand:- start:20 stop:292 length:273 start_codon:yes stop_codon:yes gene_type:complete
MSSKSRLGAATELKVAADLIKKGFHVSKSLDPQCPFDLVITNDKGESCLIDVKAKSYRKSKSYGNKPGDKINRSLTEKQKKMNIEIYEME